MSTIKVSPKIRKQLQCYKDYMLSHEYSLVTVNGYKTYLSRSLRWQEHAVLGNSSLYENIIKFLLNRKLIILKPILTVWPLFTYIIK